MSKSERTTPGDATESREALRDMAELASIAAHELRNPLMSIRGLATTGIRLYESMSDEERLEFFRLIDREAARLNSVTEQIATALAIAAGKLRYSIRPEQIGKLVEEVAWDGPRGEHPMLVEADADLVAACDRARVLEVLGSLLDNAAKFSPPDAPIEVRAYRGADGSAVVEVADRGPGIPPEEREHVFERFARWRPPGYEATPGAGLGLFISRAHMEAQGGRIEVDDEAGRGTILRFSLPQEEPS